MKRIFLIACFIQVCLFGFTQITSFSVESYKDFENNIRIYYLFIDGVQNFNQADRIRDEIVKDPIIQRFTFYEKVSNLNKCMVVTNQTLEVSKIQAMINDILVDYQNNEKQNVDIINEMPKFIDTGNPQMDNETYKQKKDEWIKNNPDKYKKLNELKTNSDNENPEKIAKEKK